jgi:hypothetical protein
VLILANVTEDEQTVPAYRLSELNFSGPLLDHLTGEIFHSGNGLGLNAYQVMWLQVRS